MSEMIALRQSGNLPLQFRGELVAESDGRWVRGKEQNRWHDIAVYTSGGKWIAHVQYRTIWQGESDRDEVIEAGDLESLAIELRSYDPTAFVAGFPEGKQFEEKQRRLLFNIRQRYEEQIGDVLLACAQHNPNRE